MNKKVIRYVNIFLTSLGLSFIYSFDDDEINIKIYFKNKSY